MKTLCACLAMVLAALPAWSWELSSEAAAAYDGLRTPLKRTFEGWLRNLPADGDADNFRELAKGGFLWTQTRPRGTLASLLALFAKADQQRSSDPVDLVLNTARGELLLWIRQENESCA